MAEIPVFLVTGFLEGGKTTFVKEIFNDPEFTKNEKIALIVCENGMESYEDEFLKENNISLMNVNKEDFTSSFLNGCNKEHKPTKVIVEYNGMWQFDIIEKLNIPKDWQWAQVITPIDAATFESYMSNMKSLLIEQFKNSDLIIFNRCNENTDKLKFRNSIKAINARANIIFELENGEIDDSPLELPFDINANVIEFKDYDYGVWYLDATESPSKYEGKSVKIKGIAYTNPKYPKNVFAFGRNAMTCCADDISFLGLLCQSKNPVNFKEKEWVEIEGVMHKQFIPQEQREVPFIAIKSCRTIEKIDEELVYF